VKKANPRLLLICFPSLPEFKKWFGDVGANFAHCLKLITCGYRDADGKERAAENVVALTETESRLRGAPVMVYCGTSSLFKVEVRVGLLREVALAQSNTVR
jgi:hypothetical protein